MTFNASTPQDQRHEPRDCPDPFISTWLDDAPDLGISAGDISRECICYQDEEDFNREMTELVLSEWRENGYDPYDD